MSRGLPPQDFSGTLVEHFLISAELLIRYERQIRAFGQVVADATVLAFAGAALPRAVRVAEEDLQVEIGGEELVLGHLLALVVGEGFEQSRWDVIQFTREGRAHSGGVFFREMAEEGEARGALNQHADGGLVPRTEDQVTLVVAGNQASFHFRWTLIDQHHVLQFALSGGDTPPAGLAPTVVTAQTGRQLPLQFAPGDDVNVAVNRFVGGVHQGQITVITFEAASDLLWRPATMQALVNFGPQRRVLVDGAVTPSRRPTPALRRTMRLGGTVTPRPAVKRQLPTDRSGRTGQPNCDDRLGVTGAQRRFQLDTFFQVQMGIGHRSPLRARRGGGKLRNGRMTAKPVLRPFLSFGGRLAKANTTRRNSVIIHGALVQMRSSNSSLSAPYVTDSYGRTALHLAADLRKDVRDYNPVAKLIPHFTHVNPLDNMQRTPLFNAARVGNIEDVRLLLAAGADPNLADKYGHTPAHVAAIKVGLKNNTISDNYFKLLTVLRENGANMSSKDSKGRDVNDCLKSFGGRVIK